MLKHKSSRYLLNGTLRNNVEAHFVTFADRRYQISIKRICRQAKEMEVFASVLGASEFHLNSAFRHKFADQLNPSVRGFGYWVWKPQVILQRLEQIPDGDFLVYADAGCHLNPSGRNRLMDYFALASHGIGLVVFELSPEQTIRKWTKADLLDWFGVAVDSEFTLQSQVAAGILVMRNSLEIRSLFASWIRVYEEDWSLVDDTPSRLPNHVSFVEHRHDQSILTLLVRTRDVSILRDSEHYPPTHPSGSLDWSLLDRYPVHARRDLQRKKWRSPFRKWKKKARKWIGRLKHQISRIAARLVT